MILGDQNFATTNPWGRYFEVNNEPSWAPNGVRLAFARRASTTFACNPTCGGANTVTSNDVYSMNADGTDVRQLTSTPEVDEVDPSFSPDGSMIAYTESRQIATTTPARSGS